MNGYIKSVESEKLQKMDDYVKSVESCVKEEMKSYSSVVQQSLPKDPAIKPDILREVVKNVVQEEDRSHSIMIFGLPDESDEDTDNKVKAVLETIGQKCKFEASRLGKFKGRDSSRAIKVTMSNSLVVGQVLTAAKKLKSVNKFEKVFISPDRSPEQRLAHRELVSAMKEKAAANPNKRYFISSGVIKFSEK